MTLTVGEVSMQAGRPPAALTRRDVALALLTVPAAQARGSLPGLRRALLGAGNPLSTPFWDSTATTLAGIDDGRATIGSVRRWLESTGTEPVQLIAGGFSWPDEDERGPQAREMHGRLVEHLEALVADDVVDPDRLAADDPDAWHTYEQAQIAWLTAPLPDGRTPMWAVDDEDSEEFLAAWDEAEADARDILRRELVGLPARTCPEPLLRHECGHLRSELAAAAWPYDLLRAAGGVDLDALPDDDHELWLLLASGVVSCRDEPPVTGDDDVAMYAAWYALDHAAWIGAVATLARLGPGTPADAFSLAHYAVTYDFEHDDEDVETDVWDLEDVGDVDHDTFDHDTFDHDADLGDEVDLEDEVVPLQSGFMTVTLLWRALGAVDADDRLTQLGWWGVPDATLQAWEPTEGGPAADAAQDSVP